MSDQDYDLNNGVQIILNRMKTNPEEFFDDGGRWRWIFKDTLREVMTEIEKAAIFEGLKEVRRLEITSRAAATVLRGEEEEKEQAEKNRLYAGNPGLTTTSFGNAIPKAENTSIKLGGFF
jgi:BioD-like phosphotransacetylase family protein